MKVRHQLEHVEGGAGVSRRERGGGGGADLQIPGCKHAGKGVALR